MDATIIQLENPNDAEIMYQEQKEIELHRQCLNDFQKQLQIMNPNNESPPPICKMDIDCCEETFDYLTLKDLRALGLTCKRMNAIAVHIFKESYPAAITYVSDGSIKTNDIHLHGYTRVIRSIKMFLGNMCDFIYIATNKFDSLKHVEFDHTDLCADRIDRIKKILGQIETLELDRCHFTGNLYEDMLKFCVNLKRLEVRSDSCNETVPIIGNGNNWLTQKYPNLEEFKLDLPIAARRIVEFDTFFLQNRSIRRFVVSTSILKTNIASIMSSNLKLDFLKISLDSEIPVDVLDKLRANGFYQRLEINDILSNQMVSHENIKRMTSLHGLEKILFFNELNSDDVNTISALVSLKQLEFYCCVGSLSAQLATQVIKLERIYFYMANVYNLRDFIYYSANLKAIKVSAIFDSNDNEPEFVLAQKSNMVALTDLPKWNRERAKLNGARKVKIFVDEQVYLATKWALKATDFGLIEIKRIDAYQGIH